MQQLTATVDKNAEAKGKVPEKFAENASDRKEETKFPK